jgi:hypothetical protein
VFGRVGDGVDHRVGAPADCRIQGSDDLAIDENLLDSAFTHGVGKRAARPVSETNSPSRFRESLGRRLPDLSRAQDEDRSAGHEPRSSKCVSAIHSHGRDVMAKLATKTRNAEPKSVFAFAKQRKEPLEDASHVRNAIARFNQVKDVTDGERDAAWKRIKTAAKKFDVEIDEKSWRELGKS